MNKIGESSNTGEKIQYAISFAVGKVHTDQFYLENSKDFKSVQIVKKLPKRKPIGGQIATIEEVWIFLLSNFINFYKILINSTLFNFIIKLPSVKDYYDGTTKLKIQVTSCNQWSTIKESCLNSKVCGWCWNTSSCIPGNAAGPLAPCLRGRFEFRSPSDSFNPLNTDNVKITRQNVQGAQLTTITPK